MIRRIGHFVGVLLFLAAIVAAFLLLALTSAGVRAT